MNLWPVEDFFSSIWGTLQYTGTPNWGKKCSTGQRFICKKITSYKIHILVVEVFALLALLKNCNMMDWMIEQYHWNNRHTFPT